MLPMIDEELKSALFKHGWERLERDYYRYLDQLLDV